MLRGSRYLVLAAVFGALAAAFALFTYGFVRTMMIVWQTFSDPQLSSKGGKLLIMGVSLYTLFVDTKMRLPGWLQANSFDDLKINLVAVVIVVMGVTFLGHVVAWDGAGKGEPGAGLGGHGSVAVRRLTTRHSAGPGHSCGA